MFFRKKIISILLFCCVLMGSAYALVAPVQKNFDGGGAFGQQPQNPAVAVAVADSGGKAEKPLSPVNPLKQDDYADLQKQYPLDAPTPDNVKSVIEYDAQTGNYIMRTKVGDMEIATPYVMTEQQYRDYSEKRAMSDYWRLKNANDTANNEKKFSLSDMKFNIPSIDKVFGPGGLQVKVQGSAELLFGIRNNKINNPTLPQRQRNVTSFDFDEKIQLNVNGKVGNKINFGINYNTESTFDFDRQIINLNYQPPRIGQGEDDIIRSIEAGNVSMNTGSTLIQGGSALFGIKTDLQFGRLKVSALLSQQQSQTQRVSSQGGAQKQRFEVSADMYDENRHFFLSHYFRDHYEENMLKAPLASAYAIQDIQVWITNKRSMYNDARHVVAFMDLAENSDKNIDKNSLNGNVWHITGQPSPDNSANDLYLRVKSLDIRNISQTNQTMENFNSANNYNLVGGEDYEKIESARMLSSSEYTLNAQMGYISLRQDLRPDEVLAVAYKYQINGEMFQVGEFTNNADAPNALIVKLLKSTGQSPNLKSWKLMMKNVYNLGAMQISAENFKLNIVYRNDSVGTDIQYLNAGAITNKMLLRVMGLDRLNYRQDAVPDGKFDFLEGYTIQSQAGRVIFPVLEPFGTHLKEEIKNDKIAEKFVYQELYDSTLVIAQEFSEKNKFKLVGEYSASGSGSEIRLNAMNVPRGSVVVMAGGMQLVENQDYTVDYIMGIVTILNQSLLNSSTNIEVKLENQNTFSMQRKTLLGTHLEYSFSKDLKLGGTIMHLSEQPLTTKVNVGSEPLKNTIWGLNGAWRYESQWLTDMIDKLPFVNVKAPSTLVMNAEFAQLIPGHSKTIGQAGYAYIDDFESSTTNIDMHYPYYWSPASEPISLYDADAVPKPEDYGKKRAHTAWFFVDNVLNGSTSQAPEHLRNNVDSKSNHFTRRVRINEVFPNRETSVTEAQLLTPLNISYYPKERGMYNLDSQDINADGTLQSPEKRWGGLMRAIDYTDFEQSNIEYIEFWLLDPFVYDPNSANKGQLKFNLGDVSEDILKDGKKFFENGLNAQGDESQNDTTKWGFVPKTQSTVTAFDNTAGARANQDVGLDGLPTSREFTYGNFRDYYQQILTKVNDAATVANWQTDPFSPFNDPAGDNYHFYRGDDYDEQQKSILDRYKYYNGTEGNSPDAGDVNQTYSTSATLLPDVEDLNHDNTLNEYEKYFEYTIDIDPIQMNVGENYISDIMESSVTLENGSTENVKWYQFRIPIKDLSNSRAKSIKDMRGFRSIRFMRMYLTGFTENMFLRFATLDLVRGDWRAYTKSLAQNGEEVASTAQLNVQSVNIEENADKRPVNYVLPPGITRQTDPAQPQLIQQNEQALLLNVTNLKNQEAKAVYKNTSLDMRNYKRLQMFVHAEKLADDHTDLQDYQLEAFIRIGSDMKQNFYEYSIPLKLTPAGIYSNLDENDRQRVWPNENMFDFAFSSLTNVKLKRNRAIQQGTHANLLLPYKDSDAPQYPNHFITVVGNPTISEVANIMIGIRNTEQQEKSGEIWVNELRMSEFEEAGGWAAMANVALNLSDIASVNFAGRTETAGFGGIESNVLTRRLDDLFQYNIQTQVDAGRFLPEKAHIELPIYFSYSNETLTPKYNPLDQDILMNQALDNLENEQAKDSLRSMAQTVATSKSFNVTNAKINIRSKKPQFYDPANFTFGYAQSETNQQTPEIERDYVKQQQADISYTYSFNVSPLQPFKKSNSKTINSPLLKIIKDINFNYLPNSIAFRTNMNRQFMQTVLRPLEVSGSGANTDDFATHSKQWLWTRQFDIRYNPFQSLQMSLATAMNSNIDETTLFAPEMDITKDKYELWRDTVWQSIKKLGTPYTYQQVFTASYNVPIAKLPYLDFINQTTASYNATYNWHRGAQLGNSSYYLGNEVTSLRDIQLSANANFETLYNKIPYLARINKLYAAQSNFNSNRSNTAQNRGQQNQKPQPPKFTKVYNFEKAKAFAVNHKLNNKELKITALDKNGKSVSFSKQIKTTNEVSITPLVTMDSVTLTVTGLNPNERPFVQKIVDFSARALMMVRSVQGTYRNSSSLTMPGFNPNAGFMGQQKVGDAYAPGFGFAFGAHNSNTVDDAWNRGWLQQNSQDTATTSNLPAIYALTQDLDLRAVIEPIPDLKINLNAKQYIAQNTTTYYQHGSTKNFTGSYNMTILSIKTSFKQIGGVATNYNSDLFNNFLAYRKVMQGRLQAQFSGRGLKYPDKGFLTTQGLEGQDYDESKSAFTESSPDVLIPAFLAAYAGKDPNKVETSPFLSLLSMFPNWSVTYNGLSRIPFIKNNFQSVSLTHKYTSVYTIGAYTSFAEWVGMYGTDNSEFGYIQNVTDNKYPISSSRYNISSVTITEQFAPLIGINATLKNSITTKLEFRKQRTIALNLTSVQLIESTSDEYVVGLGYVLKDFDVILRLKNDKQSKVKNDLRLNVDVAYKDIKSLLRKINEDVTQPSSGNRLFSIKVLADYVFSSKLNIQLFYDRQVTTPLISTSYPVAATNFGINFKIMLTR
ncbi:MAG: cell surface protein SprA [Prevotellaceae bacterium]|jgi:cell surface protein SprA|nr:cell surface protein SprA [Prevotellaceae bacterium]